MNLNVRALMAPLFRLAFVAALCIALAVLNENFLTWANIINVLRQATLLVIVGLGLTAVILTAGIDLSVGGVLALVGCTTAQLLKSGLPIPAAVLIGLAVGAAVGFLNGFMVGVIKLPPFVATYGAKWIAEGLALLLMQGQIIFGFPPSYRWVGVGYVGPIPVPIILTALLVLAFDFFLTKTVVGRDIYVLGSNRDAAYYSGVSVRRITILVYTLSGITAGIAGLLMTARLDAAELGMGEATVEGLRLGTAAGAAAAMTPGTALASPAAIARLLPQVQIRELS